MNTIPKPDYREIFTIEDGHLIGQVTEKTIDGKARLSFSVGRRIKKPNGEMGITFWFQSKHFGDIRRVLDKLELKVIRLEEQRS